MVGVGDKMPQEKKLKQQDNAELDFLLLYFSPEKVHQSPLLCSDLKGIAM